MCVCGGGGGGQDGTFSCDSALLMACLAVVCLVFHNHLLLIV